MRTDSDIQRDIEKELEWDPDIDAKNISVKVNNGGVVALVVDIEAMQRELETLRALVEAQREIIEHLKKQVKKGK